MKNLLVNIYLFYLRIFAKVQLKKINPVIIGIGGASGKSSVASFISLILREKYKIKQGKGKNSETGIPLNILGIDIDNYNLLNWLKIFILSPIKIISDWEKYEYFVVEMGIDSPFPPKNMEYLLKIVQPNIGVLTNIHIEHSVYFDPMVKEENGSARKQEILSLTAEQEGLLLKSINESGRSFINLDDSNIHSLLPLKSKTVTISTKDKNADFYISNVYLDESSFKVEFVFLNENYQINILNPLPKYYAYSLIFSIAVSFSCGFSIKDAIKILEEKFYLPPGRFSAFKGIKNTILFDSSYNSSFEPAKGALETIKQIGLNRRKVGILGDMREMGKISKLQHELLAREILRNLDFAILIGPMMKEFVVPILKKENFRFESFETFKEAKGLITDLIKEDDLILVKGSQNTLFLERAVEFLIENKKDVEKLCRRGSFWDKKRSEI